MKTNLNTSNVDKMTLAEGNVWGSHGDRFYLDNQFKLNALGLEVEFYKTGAVASAKQDGEKISNSKATKLLDSCRRAWVNLETGELMDVTTDEAEDLLAKAIDAAVEAAEKAEETVVGEYIDWADEKLEIVEKDGQFYERYVGEPMDGPLKVDGEPLTREMMRGLKAVRPWSDGAFTLPSGRIKELLHCGNDAEVAAYAGIFAAELAAADEAAREYIRGLGRERVQAHWQDFYSRYTKYFPHHTYEEHLNGFAHAFAPTYFLTEEEVKDLLK